MSPTPDLMNRLVKTLIQVLHVLAISTKYCDEAAAESKIRSFLQRGSKPHFLRALPLRLICRAHAEHYAHEFIGKRDVVDALEELDVLTSAELLASVAQINVVIRESQLLVFFSLPSHS